MQNWRTTLAGVGGAVLIVLASWLQAGDFSNYAALASAAVAAVAGYLAKDAGVSGTVK